MQVPSSGVAVRVSCSPCSGQRTGGAAPAREAVVDPACRQRARLGEIPVRPLPDRYLAGRHVIRRLQPDLGCGELEQRARGARQPGVEAQAVGDGNGAAMLDGQPHGQAIGRERVPQLRVVVEGRLVSAVESQHDLRRRLPRHPPRLAPAIAVDRIGLARPVRPQRPEPAAGFDPTAGDPVRPRYQGVAAERVRVARGTVPGSEDRHAAPVEACQPATDRRHDREGQIFRGEIDDGLSSVHCRWADGIARGFD